MSDLIIREELIERIKEEPTDGMFTHEIIECINEQPTIEAEPRWIPCSERLPKDNKPCLCWVASTTIASGETFIIGSCSNGFWFLQTYEIGTHSFPVKDYKVVAWMPLPEPYKGE